ncbi:unnamed protein product [Symbiodinium sp. CCMP2456]|nr:unnamed protein product [Symbiodinium sp. CCMP2456]
MDTRFTGAAEGPFLVLSDSTLQHLLFTPGRGKSYGVEPVMGGYAIVSPGATLVAPYRQEPKNPPVLEIRRLKQCLQDAFHRPVNVGLIPLRESLPSHKQGSYNWIAGVRDEYGLGSFELQEQTIMSLQARQDEWPTPPYLVDQLYKQNNCHFRPEVAEKAIGLLVGRALRTMRRQQPGKFQVLVICSWNSTDDNVHQEMHATAELCRATIVSELGSLAARHTQKPWALRRYLEPLAMKREMPRHLFQTYIHDDHPGPREMCDTQFQGFRFFNDADLENVVRNHAGSIGLNLIQRLTQPAHRADVFRYIQHYTTRDECWKLGLPESPAGQLPSEYLLMGIGQRGDHIFQGIIYGQPKHPLLLQAIKHSFSRRILSCIANREYMVFCKELWRLLQQDLGKEPQVGWNLTRLYGPVYLLREHLAKQYKGGATGSDGFHFKTAGGHVVALTRNWEWRRGFKGDPTAKERRAQFLLQALPQAVSEAQDVKAFAHTIEMPPREQQGALPKLGEVGENVVQSIDDNTFDAIMDVVKNEPHYYEDIQAQDVLSFIPKGLILHPMRQGWLSCRRCKQRGSQNPLEFPNSGGVLNHFRNRGGAHTPSEQAVQASSSSTAPPPPPWLPTQSASETGQIPAPEPVADQPPRSRFLLPLPSFDTEPDRLSSPPPWDTLSEKGRAVQIPTAPLAGALGLNDLRQWGRLRPEGHMVQPIAHQQGPLVGDEPPTTIPADQLKVVKYRGPIEVTELLGYEAGPSIQSRDAEIPRRERIVQECQSDAFFDWLHALATILLFNESLILGGLKSTELTALWSRRIATLSKVPWIFGPLLLVRNVTHKTSWMEAMSARLVDDDRGRLTVSLAMPEGTQSLATITVYFGVLGGLFRNMWDRDEMAALLESDDNFEIVASTAKSIYDGKVQRGMRIDHRAGDTEAKKNYLNQQKRLAEKSAAPADKRHRDGQEWREPRWQQSGWWHNYRNQGSSSEDRQDQSSSSWQWKKR